MTRGEAIVAERGYRDPGSTPGAPVLLLLLAGLLLPVGLAYALIATNELRVVAMLAGLIAVGLIFARPFWGLALFVGLLYVRPEESIPGLQAMRLTLLVSLVTLIATVLHLLISRQRPVVTPQCLMVAGFGAVGVLTSFSLGTTTMAAQEFGKLLVLVLLIVNLVRTPERYRAFITTLIVVTAYLAAYSIFLYYRGGGMDYQGLPRSMATGIFGDPNDLAAAIVAGLALALTRIVSGRGAGRLGYLALSGVMVWAILQTHSRGGLLALLVVVVGFFLLSMRQRGVALLLGLLMGAVLLVLGPARMTSFDTAEESANQRFWFWSNGVAQLQASPLLGVGYGAFPDVNGGMTAHNSFVLCFAELGLLGYFFWMGSLYFSFRRRRVEEGERARREGDPETKEEARLRGDLLGSRLAFASFLVACFWLSRTYVPLFYLLMALPVAAQVSTSASGGVWSWGKPGGYLRDAVWIAALCGISIVIIKLMADFLR